MARDERDRAVAESAKHQRECPWMHQAARDFHRAEAEAKNATYWHAQAERLEGERPEMLDALTGQRLRAEAAEARLKRVMEVLEPALKKARGVSSIYQHRSDLAAALAAAQSSEEGR